MPLNTTSFRLAIAILALMTGPLTVVAGAQGRPALAAQIAIGWVGFADDGVVSEFLAGGEARWYLGPRIAVGPEVAYIGGDNHSHFVVTGNLTFDLRAPIDGRPRPDHTVPRGRRWLVSATREKPRFPREDRSRRTKVRSRSEAG